MTYLPLVGLALFVAAILLSGRIVRPKLIALSQEDKARLIDASLGSRRGTVLLVILALTAGWYYAQQRFPGDAPLVLGAFLGALIAVIGLGVAARYRRWEAIGLPVLFRRAALTASFIRLGGLALLMAAVFWSAFR